MQSLNKTYNNSTEKQKRVYITILMVYVWKKCRQAWLHEWKKRLTSKSKNRSNQLNKQVLGHKNKWLCNLTYHWDLVNILHHVGRIAIIICDPKWGRNPLVKAMKVAIFKQENHRDLIQTPVQIGIQLQNENKTGEERASNV